MFVNVQAAVGVAGDTDRTRLATMDSFKLIDTDRNEPSPTKFPKTRQVSSTSFDDDSACTNISNHDGHVLDFDGNVTTNSDHVKGRRP